MVETQSLTQIIMETSFEAMKAAVQAMAAATETGLGARPKSNMRPKLGGPPLKQQTFHWNARDKFEELRNFWMGVNNIFITYSYSVCNTENTKN